MTVLELVVLLLMTNFMIVISSWTQTSAPAGNWYAITSNDAGTHLAAVQKSGNMPGYIFTSTNGLNTH